MILNFVIIEHEFHLWYDLVHASSIVVSNKEESFLQDFIEILKPTLQNFQNIEEIYYVYW